MELLEQALDHSVQLYSLKPPTGKEFLDIETFLEYTLTKIKKTLAYVNKHHVFFKCQLVLQVVLRKFDHDNEHWVYNEPYFNSQSFKFNHLDVLNDQLIDASHEIISSFESYIHRGSGWRLFEIIQLQLRLYEFKPFSGAGGKNQLPQYIRNKKACLSIECLQDSCFLYCILAHMFPVKCHPERGYHYRRHLQHLNTDSVHMPVTLDMIPSFEKTNPKLSINVLKYEKKKFCSIFTTRNKHSKIKINLLLYKGHYYLIRNLSRLLYADLPIKRHKWHICHFCLTRCSSMTKLRSHTLFCQKKLQRQTVPPQGTKIQFADFRNMIKNPFVLYYDTECLLKKVPGDERVKHEHIPISICAFRKSINNKFTTPPVVFTGLNCIEHFLDHLEGELDTIVHILENVNYPISWTRKTRHAFKKAEKCDMCQVVFSSKKPKYADHCHLIKLNNFRMALCNRCNLTYASQNIKHLKVPVIGHCANNYDLHFLISKIKDATKIRVIAKNSERYIALYWLPNRVFIDSYNFLSSSLSELANILSGKKDNNIDYYTAFITSIKSKQTLLKRKGVMPYEYLDHSDKLLEKKLPAKKHFYDTLSAKQIADEEYNHATAIWNSFGCKNMREYLELYLKLDVLLLAAVFESFRDSSFRDFGLDPVLYVSLPSYTFSAMMKFTNVQLECVPCVEMYNFFKKAIRGGLSGVSTRYAKANNIYCREYNPDAPTTNIIGFDLNNLYGWALMNYLPKGNFKWMTKKDICKLNVHSIPRDNPTGYFLEVDLDYPSEIHDSHSAIPLCPEHRRISPEELSPAAVKLSTLCKVKIRQGAEKLIATLYNRNNYVVHYVTLQLYLKLGMKITKIHRIISFDQSPWAAPYIKFNTIKRQQATNAFESSLYKYLCNSLFGQLLRNEFKNTDYKLVHSPEYFRRLAAKTTFHSCQKINSNLVGVQMNRDEVLCRKPIYAGVTVLDISKEHFYKFHYNFMQRLYPTDHLKYIAGDTDSFIYLCREELHDQNDIYERMKRNSHYFDLSNFYESSGLKCEKNKRRAGFMKDMYAPKVPEIFVGIRSKVYAVEFNDGKADKKVKGLKRSIIATLTMDEFKDCVTKQQTTKHTFYNIGSRRHKVMTRKFTKVGLNPVDDKRYLQDDMISTLAYGHYSISNSNKKMKH
jgi:hypothetical protein